jgi:TctA family transporter
MQSRTPVLDIWLMVGFDVVGYVIKKIGICLAPFTGVRPLQPCLGCVPVY